MKPFLSGRRALDSAPLRVPHAHKAVAVVGSVRPGAEGPSVEVVKQGDKVVRILVTCGCGEKIEVDCLYPAGG